MDLLLHFLFVAIPKALCLVLTLYFGAITLGMLLKLNTHNKRLGMPSLSKAERQEDQRLSIIRRKDVFEMGILTLFFFFLHRIIH
ncbi:hypothetical protein [Deinococcus fonticola]|uniref:hypothetical protein n=1 Tax=Deinococcus fonticola TaxID=2528713 RepID=UPI001074A210|nr:hypothetical protein [Deinococcus fonticola]